MIKSNEHSSLKFPDRSQVVIIGLGLAGLTSAYQLSKAGYQVTGFQQFPDSGYQGTSSCSYTRAFKPLSGAYPELRKRQSLEIAGWAELEKLSGLTILSKFEGALDIGPLKSKQMQYVKNQKQNKGILTPKQIMSRYPALYVPEDYYGIQRDDARLIDVKNALNALKMGALKYGAKFYYNTKMIKFNEKTKTITLRRDNVDNRQYSSDISDVTFQESGRSKFNLQKDSTIIYQRNVVMSMGPYSEQHKTDSSVKIFEVEVISITDPRGMPPCSTVFTRDGGYFYQMPYTTTKNPKQLQMKIGLSSPRCFKKWLKEISYFFPGKQNKVGLSTPCFKLVRQNCKGFNIYNENSIVWCYGFQGHGFKHGPSIGMDVKNIVDKQREYQNYKISRMTAPTPRL